MLFLIISLTVLPKNAVLVLAPSKFIIVGQPELDVVK